MKTCRWVRAICVSVGLLAVGAAQAATVTCGDSSLGVRVVVVDPALASGYCYAQAGNLQNADISSLGLTLLEKDVAPNGKLTGLLNYTAINEGTEGIWTFASSLWDQWNQIFIGFHFGNASGFPTLGNPDSFIVELSRPDTTGDWALDGANAKMTELSNIYLLAKGPRNDVPEPGTLALASLAMLGLAVARRRKA